MNSSIKAMDSRLAIEMFVAFICLHSIPSASHASQKIRLMSSERFVKR
jgi:hypothetical protein